jgi:prolyl-tRNA synthetase
MRMSRLFFQTLREVPADAEVTSHRLILRAGLAHQIAAGIWDYLPLGMRVKQKIEQIIREEMNAMGGQEVVLPVVHPAELWQRSGRWYEIGSDMARFKDRGNRDMVLGMTHEEIMAELAAHVVSSYRQLPFNLYQIQTKFRDEPRPRAGLIRVREFTMKDAYSFDRDVDGLNVNYQLYYQAYFNIFRRAGIEPVPVEADVGMMGGSMAHEFMALAEIGEDTLILCDSCGYRANRQVATYGQPDVPVAAPADLEEVDTPGVNTIAALAAFLGIEEAETAKAVFLVAEVDEDDEIKEKFVFAVLRGDMELNETKLSNAVKARRLRPAQVDEIKAIGAEAGYGSPIGIDRTNVVLVVDELITKLPNLVAGANKVDTHYRNVNYGRDYVADIVTDLVAVGEGDACPTCGAALRAVRGIEIGNIFKLGTKFSEALGATYLDENGKSHPIVMGSYGIGSDRLISSVIEEHHDESGIKWPVTIAPYQVALVSLATAKQPEVTAAADEIYATLTQAGIEVLYDDRDERAGVKFNDADLLGMPIRLTVGGRGLQNGIVEMKLRRNGESAELPLDNLVAELEAIINAETEAILATLVEETLG